MKRLIALMTVSGMTLLGLIAVGGPTQAKVSSPNGQILFTRPDPATGNERLFTANPDGSHEVQLQPLSADVGCGSWSPDGSKVLENTANPQGVPRQATVNSDGSGFKLLDNPDQGLFLGCGNWSPDMARVSSEGFGVTDPARNGIYTMRSSDGRGLFRVTSNPGGDDNPWGYSPDGSKILFSRIVPGCLGAACDNGDVFVVNIDGTGLRQLNPTSIRAACCSAGWSPDGGRVVFAGIFKSSTGSGSQSAVFVVNVDGTGLHQLTPDGLGARQPQWSPDGQLIAFNNESRQSGLQIFVVHPDGSGLARVTDPTNGDFSFEPVWSPDSTRLLFSRFHPQGVENLWIANADGTGLTEVANTDGFEEPAGWGTHPLAT